jgi:hypothetical protein
VCLEERSLLLCVVGLSRDCLSTMVDCDADDDDRREREMNSVTQWCTYTTRRPS